MADVVLTELEKMKLTTEDEEVNCTSCFKVLASRSGPSIARLTLTLEVSKPGAATGRIQRPA